MLNIGIVGAGGRMGQQIARAIAAHSACRLAAAFDHPEHPGLGQPVVVDGVACPGVLLSGVLQQSASPLAAIIDFSAPEATLRSLQWCAENGVALVIGTTGLTGAHLEAVDRAAERISVVVSPNMSVGVNALFELTRIGARTVGLDWEFEVVEAHHRDKKDSPSGTAIRLGEVLAEERGGTLDKLGVFARHGMTGARTKDEIGMQTLRGGDIIGEHTVFLIGDGERIELTHRALTRGIFASGAVRAAVWATAQRPGRYSMRDVLGF